MYKVLVVEDEEIIRKGISFKMDWMNYGCVVVGTAADGEEGLEKIISLKPDIVITDIRMPFKDGLKMVEEARDRHEFETIILSGHDEFKYAQQAVSLEVTEYILKPINFSLLGKALQKLMKKKETIHKQPINQYKTILDIDLLEKSSSLTLRTLEYIKLNYFCKVSLQEASDHCKISSVHLNAKLKEDTSYTFNDLLNRYRIMKAIELLQSEDDLIYEIAEEVGFKDYKYFSQVFKKYIGYSPSNFIKSQ